MKYHFQVHKSSKNGCWAECVELQGCQTQANSPKALLKNMKEALNIFLDEPPDSKLIYPLPKTNLRGKNIVSVGVDPKVAFAFYLRRLRLKRGLSQKEVAQKLGLKNLYSYQRLESSKTANPELLTLHELKKVFNDFSLDELMAA